MDQKTIAMLLATRGATILATALVTHGIIQANEQTMVIGALTAVAAGLGTWWETSGQAKVTGILKAEVDHWKGKAKGQKLTAESQAVTK